MNRFQKRKHYHTSVSLFFPIITFIPIICLFYFGIQSLSATNDAEQKKSLENALLKDVVHCYAVEGIYPPSLDYIVNNYGLIYDKDKYFIDYQPIGTNILPDMTVLSLSDSDGGED